jgi:hypothetical protein
LLYHAELLAVANHAGELSFLPWGQSERRCRSHQALRDLDAEALAGADRSMRACDVAPRWIDSTYSDNRARVMCNGMGSPAALAFGLVGFLASHKTCFQGAPADWI